eukprot:1160959-Pelagomonas_calceolata.AAC.3
MSMYMRCLSQDAPCHEGLGESERFHCSSTDASYGPHCCRCYLPKLPGPSTCAVLVASQKGEGCPMLLGQVTIWDDTMDVVLLPEPCRFLAAARNNESSMQRTCSSSLSSADRLSGCPWGEAEAFSPPACSWPSLQRLNKQDAIESSVSEWTGICAHMHKHVHLDKYRRLLESTKSSSVCMHTSTRLAAGAPSWKGKPLITQHEDGKHPISCQHT